MSLMLFYLLFLCGTLGLLGRHGYGFSSSGLDSDSYVSDETGWYSLGYQPFNRSCWAALASSRWTTDDAVGRCGHCGHYCTFAQPLSVVMPLEKTQLYAWYGESPRLQLSWLPIVWGEGIRDEAYYTRVLLISQPSLMVLSGYLAFGQGLGLFNR